MKRILKTINLLLLALILLAGVLLILHLWGIELLSWTVLVKCMISLCIAEGLVLIAWLGWRLFAGKEKADCSTGNNAHRVN